jgi:16S rRNA (guanine527-N7)-methyltransferase
MSTERITDLRPRLDAGLEALQLSLPDDACLRLLAYIDLLNRWNRRYNLTAIRDPEQMLTRHLMDALSIAPYVQGQHILDVGSGAGLPGIPLAITFPGRSFVLLDSNNKKTRFMLQASAELSLANINVVHGRVEDYNPDIVFDTIVARAFAPLDRLLELTGRLLTASGQLLVMTGSRPGVADQALASPYKIREIIQLQVPGLDAQRHLLCIGREQG